MTEADRQAGGAEEGDAETAHADAGRADSTLWGFRVPSIWLVAGGGWIGRGIQVIAQLVAVRILIQGLGTAGYGVFAVLASLNGWLLLSDFCIGISLQNHISERRAAGQDTEDLILTGALLSLGAVCIMGLVVLLIGPWLSHMVLGEVGFLSASDRTLAFYAVAFPGIGTALGTVMYRIWFARHRGYLSNLVPAAGTVIGTASVWALQHTHAEPRIALATAFYYAPLAVLPLIALAATVARARRNHRFHRELVRPLLSRAFRFWVSGLLAAAVLQVDYIIMVQVLDVHDIVIYSVATKLFLLIFFVYNALLQALWPVCSEAIARHDWHSVRTIVNKYIAFGVVFTLVAGVGVAIVNPWIVRLLAPGLNTPIPMIVIALLTFYIMIRVWTDTFAMVLQSMNDLLLMWLVAPIQSLLSIGLQILGARWFGLPGVIGGLIGCFVLTAVWVLPLRCWLHARRDALT
ncbi:MATE family efflux transporter [Sphingomonas sp. OK281]|uniref:MATE family efflux transporter n=1 Tax=Sphingomonas sp. OK281 TaxID=1881067 RepID=UPI0008ED1FF3|nr:MATE family efflux transporter [Sphingomonas sp. OK281]SFO10864.1 Membrane protein involved in the export of O-antigen and teichoic acid [Sphingomonas sp. OK281]